MKKIFAHTLLICGLLVPTVVVAQPGYQGGYNRPGGPGGYRPNVPRVRCDTSGRGNFSGIGRGVRITRGWVDTTGRPSVSLSGEGNFRINFWGEITNQRGPREFTMRITGTDRGNASGTATFRFNNDMNEVEYINVNGRMNGRNFSGSFNR